MLTKLVNISFTRSIRSLDRVGFVTLNSISEVLSRWCRTQRILKFQNAFVLQMGCLLLVLNFHVSWLRVVLQAHSFKSKFSVFWCHKKKLNRTGICLTVSLCEVFTLNLTVLSKLTIQNCGVCSTWIGAHHVTFLNK